MTAHSVAEGNTPSPSSPSVTPSPNFQQHADSYWHPHAAPNTSLELALYSLGKQGKPITVKSALSAYLQIIGFHDHPSLLDPGVKTKSPYAAKSGHPFEGITVQDLLATFEHALDKHPLPRRAVLRPKRKRRMAQAVDDAVSTQRPLRKRRPKLRDPSARPPHRCYNRPFILEVDQLRYEYYTAKRLSVPGCLCGKCGVPLDASGQPVLDEFPPELERFRSYVDMSRTVDVDPRHVPELERYLAQKGADLSRPILVDTHVGYVRTIDENTPVMDVFPHTIASAQKGSRTHGGYLDGAFLSLAIVLQADAGNSVTVKFGPETFQSATKHGASKRTHPPSWSTNSSDTDSSCLNTGSAQVRLPS